MGAPQLQDLAILAFDNLFQLDHVGEAQLDLAARLQPEVTLRRGLIEVVPIDEDLSCELQRPRALFWPAGMVRRLRLLHLALGKVLDDNLDGVQHGHPPVDLWLQVLPDGFLQEPTVHGGVGSCDSDPHDEVLECLWSDTSPPHATDRRHARIVPPIDNLLLHQLQQLPLGHHCVGDIQPRELELMWPSFDWQVVAVPVVERTMSLKLKGANGVCDALDRILLAVGKIVKGIDTPLLTCTMVLLVDNTIHGRVPQVHVRALHVNLRTQQMSALLVLSITHFAEKRHVLLGRPAPERAVFAWLFQVASQLPHLFHRLRVHISLAILDQELGPLVELVEVRRSEEQILAPVEAKPLHVLLDAFHILRLLRSRIRVVEAQVTPAAILLG
mmetsp:Transcript_1601/g.2416  ORF Transcript_1601/g.2416 Transcript_1601/m.2416 type:complete len:386 (-) Transcript_1601:245-1402(-)